MRFPDLDKWTRLSILGLIVLSVSTMFLGVQALSTTRNSVIQPGSLSEAYCTHLIYFDGSNFFSKSCKDGSIDAGSTTLSAELNSQIAADFAANGGIEFIQNSGVVTTGQWGTTLVTLHGTVKVDFEWGPIYNVNPTGDVFFGNDANGQYNLVFNSEFLVYGAVTNFLHISNSIESDVYIAQIGSGTGSIIAGTKAIYLDGNPAYYNKITILNAFKMDTVVHFPMVTVGANANTIPYITCQGVNYCVKIDSGVSDNQIQRMVIDAQGIINSGTNAAVYINGFSNVVDYLYGEYNSGASTGGPLLYLDTSAQKNMVNQLLQEGSGGTFTNVESTHNNYIGRWPLPASGSVTAGASVWTYTNADAMREQMVLLTVNGLTGENCNSVGIDSTILKQGFSCVLAPGSTMTATWATTAPVYQKIYIA